MSNVQTSGSGASQSKQGLVSRLTSWAKHHQRVSGESLGSLLQNGLASLMTWTVIGIALALPAILLVMLNNLSLLSESWDGKPRINIFLDKNLSPEETQAFFGKISAWQQVDSASLISADDALEEFQSLSGFGEVVLALEDNPLPAVVLLEPEDTEGAAVGMLVRRLEGQSGVDSVSVDLEWIQRLNALLSLGERLVTAVSVFLAMGVLLIVGNTIRLSIENRRSEIEVIKLVGGTDAFVRRPFLYLGFWYGLGGGLIAWLLLAASLFYLNEPIVRLAGAYGKPFSLVGLNLVETLGFWGLGASLGIAGAWLAVGRHLKHIEP